MNVFIDHWYTPFRNKSNYSAIIDFHTLQLTSTPKSSQSALVISWQRILT
jgi:hypothetical protein